MFTHKLTKLLFTALTVLCIGGLFTACEKSDDETKTDPTAGGKTTEQQEVEMSDMDNFIEMSLKMEKMRLLFVKFFSNNWEGDLLAGPGAKSDPSEMYALLEEILDKKDQYSKAVKNLDNQGFFDKTATRGIWSATWDMIYYGWGSTAHNREQDILEVLNKSGIMGNEEQMRDLFNQTDHKKGETDYKQWFKNLVNGEYTNACPAIYRNWFTTGARISNYNEGPGVQTFFNYVDGKSKGNAIWEDAYKVGLEQVQKAGNFNVALWDTAMGGYIGKWQDANTIAEETAKLRQKILKGTASSKDIRRFVAGVGGVWVKEKLNDLFDFGTDEMDDDVKRLMLEMTENTLNTIAGEAEDWLIDKAMEESTDEKTLKDNDEAIIKVKNNDESQKPAVVIVTKEDGGMTLAGTDKNGNATIPVKPGKNTVTTITDDGKATKQPVDTKAGKNEVEAQPEENVEDPDFDIESDPEELIFDAGEDMQVVTVYTNYNFIKADSPDDWIEVGQNARNFFVSVKENTTGKDRKGTIYIYASENEKDIMKIHTINVIQRAPVDFGLDFIDFNKLHIVKMSGFSGVYALGKANTSIDNDELTITRESDGVYSVKARITDTQYIGAENVDVDPNYYVYPERPYGVYYDISFKVEVAEPWIMIDKNNFRLTDIHVKGNYKVIDEVYKADEYCEFDLYWSGMGIENIDTYDDGASGFAHLCTYNQEASMLDENNKQVEAEYPYEASKKEKTTRIQAIWGKDEKGNDIITGYKAKTETDNRNTTNCGDSGFMHYIELRWK